MSIPPPAGFGGMGGRKVALTAQGRTDRTDKRGSGGFVSWGLVLIRAAFVPGCVTTAHAECGVYCGVCPRDYFNNTLISMH